MNIKIILTQGHSCSFKGRLTILFFILRIAAKFRCWWLECFMHSRVCPQFWFNCNTVKYTLLCSNDTALGMIVDLLLNLYMIYTASIHPIILYSDGYIKFLMHHYMAGFSRSITSCERNPTSFFYRCECIMSFMLAQLSDLAVKDRLSKNLSKRQ